MPDTTTPTPAPAIGTSAIGTALTTALGPWGALAALAYEFGVPFVEGLIANAANAADPTPANWAAQAALIMTPGTTLIPERPSTAAAQLVPARVG